MISNPHGLIPNGIAGSHRTGTLVNITVEEISAVLGFGPNVEDDPLKVKHSWGFEHPGSGNYGIWDYKGSAEDNEFSTYGDKALFYHLFGDRYIHGR